MNKYDERSLNQKKRPYSFQQKIVPRYIKDKFIGKMRVSMLMTYFTICWIASDFSSGKKEVRNWPQTIATYSGIGKGTAQRCVRQLTELNLIRYTQVKNSKGRWNKRMVVLPEQLPSEVMALETKGGTPEHDFPVASETPTL